MTAICAAPEGAREFSILLLAPLYLTLHDGNRAWKGHDWDAMERVHAKGYISNPATSAKSVVLTDEGMELSERVCEKHFSRTS